jgi:peptidoglycan hydrolase CwlO-like protein
MIHLYLYILSFIKENDKDEDYKLAYPSINNISEALGLSEYTILKYIKVLKEQNILYYDSIGYKIVNGEYKMTNTYYCRMDDKDILDKFIETKRQDKGVTPMSKKDKNITNSKRSLKQKINKLYKKQDKSQEETDKLKELEKEYEQLQK